MSWLRSSPLRTSFSKQRSRDSPPKDADPSACYDSFCKHSQQIYEIILHSLPPKGIPSQDDVLGVVNHVDQMVTLLILELRDSNSHNYYQQANTATHSPCLEYLLSENLLVKLYDWSIHTGRTFSPQKEFFVSAMVNKIFIMVKDVLRLQSCST
ncbi:FHIP family protein GK23746-like [Temnothorax nylanderi]|uniref:FHIP family protein GK23746-like n=1 Tax=Temnothorax nylanderi TaxID=102681 RepID=UPI003A8A108C